jgi:hypothetical protein
MIEVVNPSSLQANIWCATSQPSTQHVLITINNRKQISTCKHQEASIGLNKTWYWFLRLFMHNTFVLQMEK